MLIAGTGSYHRDDTRGNYHSCSVRTFSWANKSGALGVVYCNRNRLWLDAGSFAFDDRTGAYARGVQSRAVSLYDIVTIRSAWASGNGEDLNPNIDGAFNSLPH
jgi:hypothetical protein